MFLYTKNHAKNILDIFGYLDLRLPEGFDYDGMVSEVNMSASKLFSRSWNEIVKQRNPFIVPAFADQSAVASDFMVHHLDKIVKQLIGDNYYYIGSDASVFFMAGSAWHRDMAIRLPLLKLNIYLDFNKSDKSCDFLIIPGSHHVDSSYAGLLQNALGWPDVLGLDGGFSERGILPAGSDPTSPCYRHELDYLPSKKISVKRGTALIFNTAAIHAVKSDIQIGMPRRLVTFLFCANPADLSEMHYCRDPQGKKIGNEELMKELYYWRAIECRRFNVKDYGDELHKYPEFIKNHGLDWNKIIQLSENLVEDLDQEDGHHDQNQAAKMREFLTQNIPRVTGDLN